MALTSTTTEASDRTALPADLSEAVRDDGALRRFLHGLPGVDQVGLEQRSAGLATRSIKKDSKLWAIDTAISMVDLTTLEGADTPGKIRSLAAKAKQPDSDYPDVPRVAALCVYPDLVEIAVDLVRGTGIGVASVATAFPSGRSSREVKLADTRLAVEAGATEIDMVIDRGAFLSGRYGQVFEEIQAIKQACGSAHLKVILETGELATYDNVRRASWLALLAGGDFIKTSTGKVSPAATLPVTQLMLQAVRDWHGRTGEYRGVKPAGGIRTTKDGIRHLVAVNEIAGPEWLTPELFRFGASSLLTDLLMQRRAQRNGHYSGPDYVTVD
ncbi:deoxyribose-phosphate aldolase [Actinoalloteichus hymeniacidonis]|uniref:Deoxyribose-phosphate aldolase n=1 Tax=Actinoalloteichus hymeniacidonis TaxID=340345 RepID=A0AAC9HTX0_9PSEU|nr:deoxyribose-phosphate aldolase [Actinoalloteichus hymeniacidonis]AOS65637.1 deoxyribose-phosphate aldolase [Actinoalloteichus hymeniacidonis]MBB5906273.1 deoxyribose-phosphate aldolase [Actinoalloteichus hymeniacidonis]